MKTFIVTSTEFIEARGVPLSVHLMQETAKSSVTML